MIAAVLAYGLVKENDVPERDIEPAIRSELNFKLNYELHSLAMLNQITAALNQRVEIRFVSSERRLRAA